MIDSIKVSEKAKLQLITIKKRTRIPNWNVVCRWAFLLSLKNTSKPALENISTDSNVEMTWKTFSGNYDRLYLSLLLKRLTTDNIDLSKESINKYFKIHLHRGISYLSGKNYKKITDYINVINE
jgi:DNA sulfur modification protein DndE